MPYTGIQFGAFRTQLAERLNDTGKVYHTDAELKLHTFDALRLWNILTGDNKVSFALQVNSNPVWYDLHGFLGTRIQTTGGGALIKYQIAIAPGVAGHTYRASVLVKNQGLTNVLVNMNAGAPGGQIIPPGQIVQVNISVFETGSNCGAGVPCQQQLRFNTANVGDSMDIVAINPSYTDNNGPNLFTGNDLLFSNGPFGWAGFSGDVVTLTQLFQATNSPRQTTLTDQDVYTRITAALLEPLFPAALQTSQFLLDDIVQATQRKRDEFLFRTGCTSTIETIPVSANTSTVALPQTVIQPRRGYWLPQVIQGSNQVAMPLFRLDEKSVAYYQPFAPGTPGQPVGFSAGIEPLLTLEVIPAPTTDGQIELITIESQGALSPTVPTPLMMPNDFMPALFWGAIADLFSIPFLARDDTRAAIARQRFEEYIELMAIYPSVFAARVNGVATMVSAVENLDIYNPNWRTSTSQPSSVGTSGQNLVAFPTSVTANIILVMLANATLPVNDTDFIQLGDEVIDVILDEAVSLAMFKIGGAEAVAAHELHKNILRLAAKRNDKIRALSTFRDVMYNLTASEDMIAPREVSNDVD